MRPADETAELLRRQELFPDVPLELLLENFRRELGYPTAIRW